MSLRLRNKTALVTGGGSGIGQSVCLRLAQEGAHIIILDLTLEAAQQTADKILSNGDTVSTYACDVSNHAQVNEVLAEIQHTHCIDMLINNAGSDHIGNSTKTSESV